MNIYAYADYKKLIKDRIKANADQYGYKSRLAEAAGCQKSFFSQVLSASIHLTPEHAAGLAEFWKLAMTEKEYFIELVNFARAGNQVLQEYLRKRLDRLKAEGENFSSRYQNKTILPDQEASLYYSAWHYSAVHILITIPQYQTIKTIARRLQIDEQFVTKVLNDLHSMGLAEKHGDVWKASNKIVHLPKDALLNGLNHHHWRSRAIDNSFLLADRDIHYTGVCSLSWEDIEKLRQLTIQFIDKSREIIVPSKEEELFCMTCDFFKV